MFISLVVTGILLLVRRPILYVLGCSDAMYPYAERYFTIYICGTVASLCGVGLNQFLLAQGFARKGMISVIIGAVANVILDPSVLNRQGISFVKVDGQSSATWYFENDLPLAQAVRGMNEALESGASRMDGGVINCMGMAMENILARPATAVSRNSDDFVPDKEGGFAEHLLQNAYNALYHNELYCCDWDMFWTMHKDAVKHSLLRAVSGGPVYVGDKPGLPIRKF